MELNNRTLQELIAKCLFGGNWEKCLQYVIPRKGNFLNPQYLTDANTYAIYYIDTKEKRITNLEATEYTKPVAVTKRAATIKMRVCVQFVGLHAEEWADTLLFWDERKDVQEVFLQYQSQLSLGKRIIDTVPFQQEGVNGEMSYLASFETISTVSNEEMVEYWTTPVWFKGSLTVER